MNSKQTNVKKLNTKTNKHLNKITTKQTNYKTNKLQNKQTTKQTNTKTNKLQNKRTLKQREAKTNKILLKEFGTDCLGLVLLLDRVVRGNLDYGYHI